MNWQHGLAFHFHQTTPGLTALNVSRYVFQSARKVAAACHANIKSVLAEQSGVTQVNGVINMRGVTRKLIRTWSCCWAAFDGALPSFAVVMIPQRCEKLLFLRQEEEKKCKYRNARTALQQRTGRQKEKKKKKKGKRSFHGAHRLRVQRPRCEITSGKKDALVREKRGKKICESQRRRRRRQHTHTNRHTRIERERGRERGGGGGWGGEGGCHTSLFEMLHAGLCVRPHAQNARRACAVDWTGSN